MGKVITCVQCMGTCIGRPFYINYILTPSHYCEYFDTFITFVLFENFPKIHGIHCLSLYSVTSL